MLQDSFERLIVSGEGFLEALARTVYMFSPEDYSSLIDAGNLRCALVSVDSNVKHRAVLEMITSKPSNQFLKIASNYAVTVARVAGPRVFFRK